METLCINNIENGLRGLRLGTKTQETCGVGKWLNKLRVVNEALWEDYMDKYQAQLKKPVKPIRRRIKQK